MHFHLLQEKKGCGKRLPVPGFVGQEGSKHFLSFSHIITEIFKAEGIQVEEENNLLEVTGFAQRTWAD